MLGLFSSASPFFKIKKEAFILKPNSYVFQLHYRATFGILLLFIILISSYEYIDTSGSAIQCYVDRGAGIPNDVINRFCWMQSTFSLPRHFSADSVNGINPGVGPYSGEEEGPKYHAYYQWVPLFLSFQALCFYFPHWLWKNIEGGRMEIIANELKKLDIENGSEKMRLIAEYFVLQMESKYEHNIWAIKYLTCELLNFTNVIFQISITNTFLRGEFSSYGRDVLNHSSTDPEDRNDPMNVVFPKIAKCTFHKYGASGTLQILDAYCVLGMNILNEKIFIFLWFWYWILLSFNLLNILFRSLHYFYPQIRNARPEVQRWNHWNLTEKYKKKTDLIRKMKFSDWLIFSQLAKLVEKDKMDELLSEISEDTFKKREIAENEILL